MGLHDEGPDRNITRNAIPHDQEHPAAPRFVPCNDARGRVLPITPDEQARIARAIAAVIQRMYALTAEDPPEVWQEAMRDLDAHRPHRKPLERLD